MISGKSAMILNPFRTGVALGAFLGLWHLIWSGLVALGWAQPVIDFVLWMHFLRLTVATAPFDASVATMLVAVTAAVGFVMGSVFASIWNWVQQPSGAGRRASAH
jgi:hypothetical protein